MAFQPVRQRKPSDRARPCRCGIRRRSPSTRSTAAAIASGIRRHLPLPGREVRDSHSGRVADQFDRATAGRVGDREPARHRLEDDVGHGSCIFVWRRTCARRSTDGASRCVVLAEKLDVRSKAELGDERRRVDDDPPGDKEPSAGMRRVECAQASAGRARCGRPASGRRRGAAPARRPADRRQGRTARCRPRSGGSPTPTRLAEEPIGGALQNSLW